MNAYNREVARMLGCEMSQLWSEGCFRSTLRPLRSAAPPLIAWHVQPDLVQFGGVLPPQPLLSVICVRWYDYWTDSQESSDYNTLNDGYFKDLLEGPDSMAKLIPGQYEVCTIFIKSTKDLKKLDPRALRATLRGRNVAAWYFVWPQTDTAGYVAEPELFRFCQFMERAPIRSTWPHESHLYRILCGKLWIPQMCLNRKYRVPPTTRVHAAEFRRDPKGAAARALGCLMKLRRRVWNKGALPADDFRGVVKMGFSWCGHDVLPFRGVPSLVKNLGRLFGHKECASGTCLVQEMVPEVVAEHRVLCFHDGSRGGFHREPLWMEVAKPERLPKHGVTRMDVDEFRFTVSCAVPPERIRKQLPKLGSQALQMAELEANKVVDQWLAWFKTETPTPPQVTRIDFLVCCHSPRVAEVWTVEVGECGGSLCSVEVNGRNISSLNGAVLHDPGGTLPKPLPEKLPRNSGWKS